LADSFENLHQQIISCRLCPRLVEHRETIAREKRAAFRDWTYWGKPITGFGDPDARLLIIGLAPAAHGGNRTGRIFTGDSSGDFLMRALHESGFANQPTSRSRDDGLRLSDAYIVAVARCAPPDNKPLPAEILNCRPFLLGEIALLARVQAVLGLGKIALDGYVDALRTSRPELKRPKFGHGAEFQLGEGLPRLFLSYHPSRQNTQTGRLTPEMLVSVLQRVRAFLDRQEK